MPYTTDREQRIIAWLDENRKSFRESEIESLYEDFLDEVYGDVQVAGYSYSTSYALKELDPTAFRCSCNDWSSEEFTDFYGDYCYRQSDWDDAESEIDDQIAVEEEEEEEEEEEAEDPEYALNN